ncbi:hypothetical protein NL108_014126 [Boleophthalmus pectinirostris]|nr:hypothetical protein NL108_014126 [Boleophthalmus pectinirostris]
MFCSRDDKHFRTVFLFQDKHRTFMDEFRQKKQVMLQFLEDVEICAVKLDKMTKGARISNVTGSSVGLVGGALSIVGLALIPVTFGASMALIGTGAGLGVLSGANAVTTLAVEKGVNHTQKKEAEKRFENFMEDMNFLQNCLDDVINQHIENVPENPITLNARMASDCASGLKVGNIIGKGAEVGVAAAKGAVAIGKAARGGFIALNALFIGVDVFLIVNNSIDLYKGAPNEASKFLRARAALWKSEIDSMQQICDSLEEGQQQYEDKKQQLQRLFYEG